MRISEFGYISPTVAKPYVDEGFISELVTPRFSHLVDVVYGLESDEQRRSFEATLTKSVDKVAQNIIKSEGTYNQTLRTLVNFDPNLLAFQRQLLNRDLREMRDSISVARLYDCMFGQHRNAGLTACIAGPSRVNTLLKLSAQTYSEDNPATRVAALKDFFTLYGDIASLDSLITKTNIGLVLFMLDAARDKGLPAVFASGICSAIKDPRLKRLIKPFDLYVAAVDMADGCMIAFPSGNRTGFSYRDCENFTTIKNIITDVFDGLNSADVHQNRRALDVLGATDRLLHEQVYRLGEIAQRVPSDVFAALAAERVEWDAALLRILTHGKILEPKFRHRLPERVKDLVSGHSAKLAKAEVTIAKTSNDLPKEKASSAGLTILNRSVSGSPRPLNIGSMYVSLRVIKSDKEKKEKDAGQALNDPRNPRANSATIRQLARAMGIQRVRRSVRRGLG